MQFHIDDMTCGGCASTVKKTILALDANATVITDPATRLVEAETSLSGEQIAVALQKAGFPLREMSLLIATGLATGRSRYDNHVSLFFA